MKRTSRTWTLVVTASAGTAIGLLALLPGTAGATPPASSLVISPSYAKSIGFSKTVQAAKVTKVTTQKGCTQSIEAVYEDSTGKTGLVSETLQCSTSAAAAKALGVARKEIKVDDSLDPPRQLGSTAFVTASDAPEYLMVWQAGTRLGVTAMDIDVSATSSETATTVPATLSSAQVKKLSGAALHQNSLY
jgi:hypothetical protein